MLLLSLSLLIISSSGYLLPQLQPHQLSDYYSPPQTQHNLREYIFLTPEARIPPSERTKRFFWDWMKKEKTNRRYGMWITAMNKEGNKHQKNFYDGVDRWNIY